VENFITQALRGFSIKCRGATKEKSYYVCNTDKGLKILQKAEGSPDNILFQHKIKETLFENGFKNIDRFALSQSGAPYVAVDNEIYTAADRAPAQKDTDFSDAVEFARITSSVAEMHYILKKASLERTNIMMYVNGGKNADEMYNKYMSELKYYKKIVSRKSRMSDFDVLFIKNYDFYAGALADWHEIIKSPGYANVIAGGYAECYVCHNLLKEETVVKSNDEIYITNFSECGVSHYINDFSSIIKRHIKNASPAYVPLGEIIRVYSAANPLSADEIQALRADLIFPDKFLKICSMYYSKKRSWIPAAFVERVESVTSGRERQLQYINEFYSGF